MREGAHLSFCYTGYSRPSPRLVRAKATTHDRWPSALVMVLGAEKRRVQTSIKIPESSIVRRDSAQRPSFGSSSFHHSTTAWRGFEFPMSSESPPYVPAIAGALTVSIFSRCLELRIHSPRGAPCEQQSSSPHSLPPDWRAEDTICKATRFQKNVFDQQGLFVPLELVCTLRDAT